MTRTTRIVLLVAAVAAAGTAAVLLVSRDAAPARDRGPVIARVDGTPIYLSDARARVEGIATVHGDIADALGEDWPDVIMKSLVDDVIARREAERLGIGPDDQTVQASVDRIRSGHPSEDAFTTWLAEQGMDLPELERRIRLNLLTAEVYVAVTDGVTVSPEEVRTYYRRHRADYDTGERIVPLLEVRVEIRELLQKRKEDRAFARWLEDQRETVDVSVVLDEWWRRV